MATLAYGYGPNVWNTGTRTGPVDMPTISQPGGAAPQFKDPNPYAASAAKMVGEIAYGAMQEQMAPEYVGFNERLGKDVYRIKQGSAQFAPEGGWDANKPENSIFERDLERALAELRVKEQEQLVDFNTQLSQGFGSMPTEYSNLQRPITQEEAIKFEGFEPSMIPKETETKETEPSKESLKFIEPNDSDFSRMLGNSAEIAAASTRIRTAAQPYKTSFIDAYTLDSFMKQDKKDKHLEEEEFFKWANNMQYSNGAGEHFKINSGSPNYEAIKLYEQNPLQYWRDNIKGKE